MLGRLAPGIALARLSWLMVRTNPVLLALAATGAVLAGLVAALAGGAVVVLAVRAGQADQLLDPRSWQLAGPVVWFGAAYVVLFFNAAVVAGVLEIHSGTRPTARGCLAVAWGLRWRLAGWALLTAGVGVLLRLAAGRLGFLGRIGTWVAAGSWSVATLMVVPVIVSERAGPRAALRRSGGLVRGRWGSSVVGRASMALVAGLAMFALAVPVAAAAFSVSGLVGYVVLAVLTMVYLGLQSALSGAYAASLYLYANGGADPRWFPAERLRSAVA